MYSVFLPSRVGASAIVRTTDDGIERLFIPQGLAMKLLGKSQDELAAEWQGIELDPYTELEA